MIGIITDQHFGLRKGSKVFHDYMEEFYNNTFMKRYSWEGHPVLPI